MGQPIFAEGVQLIEDPARPRGLGSSPFDDEGVATVASGLIVEGGVLTTWLLNTGLGPPAEAWRRPAHASRGLAGAPGVSTHNLTVGARRGHARRR